MLFAEVLNFDVRDGIGIIYTFALNPSIPFDESIETGNRIGLKKDDYIDIKVRVSSVNNDGTYSGNVLYVEPYMALAAEGVDDGVEITFYHEHIFTCTKL